MTIDDALAYGRSQLTHSPTPALDSRLLLQHVLQKEHAYLIAHGDERITAVQETQFHAAIQRAQAHEPIPYITGTVPFFDLDLIVTPDVLIPRPETELLVEKALQWARIHTPSVIVDVGAGSGCIPIVLSRALPNTVCFATDISDAALDIARQNADQYAPARITFLQGNLLAPLPKSPDLITANLPYIADSEWTMLDDSVKLHEPSLALRGGADGLDVIRELLQQATTRLRPGGAIFLEIGWQQGAAAQQLAASAFPTARIIVHKDYANHDRILAIETVNGDR